MSELTQSCTSAPLAEPCHNRGQFVQIFVEFDSGARTLPLRVNRNETTAQLQDKICKEAGLTDVAIQLICNGRPINNSHIKQMRPQSSIRVILNHLPGGMNAGGKNVTEDDDQDNAGNDTGALAGEVFATIQCGEDDPINVPKNQTLEELKEIFEEANPNLLKEYTYQFIINGIEIVLEDHDLTNVKLTDLGHEPGRIIRVKTQSLDTKQLPASDQFMVQIDFLKQPQVRRKINALLKPAQKELITKIQESRIDEDEDFIRILQTMTDNQMDKLLEDFQKTNKMQLLQYLLTKAGQWTDISETVTNNATEESKDHQIRRLMNKQQNSFDPENENDKMLVALLRENQDVVLQAVLKNRTVTQKLEMLLQICDAEQRGLFIEQINQGDIQKFWDTLIKERRMDIWDNMADYIKFNFLITDKYLSDDQKLRLWDNIGKERRLSMWQKAKQPNVVDGCLEQSEVLSQSLTTAREKHKYLQRKLLEPLTVVQRVRLWTNLDEIEKSQLIFAITSDAERTIEFWKLLNFEKKCIFVDLIEPQSLQNLFMAMDLEYRVQLLAMVNDENKTVLQQRLTPSELNQLFFYNHFTMKEQTPKDSAEFINSLVDEYYSNNNQVVPFDKIDDGYVQCIHDPNVANGFITVQIVEPSYYVDNTVFLVGADATEQELETDEARRVNAQKKVKNDMFRMTENLYGQLHEKEPCQARNSQKLGIISFYEYSQEQGIWCTHSFFAPNPVTFRSNGKSSSELVLFKGNNGDIFFFNQKEVIMPGGSGNEKQLDLYLQIIDTEQTSEGGENQRETNENCHSFAISDNSSLFDFLMHGRFSMREFQSVIYMLNSVPTIIQEGNEKFVVFSHATNPTPEVDPNRKYKNSDLLPSLFFYSVSKRRETSRMKGIEALIDYYSDPEQPGRGRIICMGNKEVMNAPIWDDNEVEIRDQQALYDRRGSQGKIFLNSRFAVKKTTVIISMQSSLIDDLQREEIQQIIKQGNDGRLTSNPINIDKDKPEITQMMDYNPTFHAPDHQVFLIEQQDDDGTFEERYRRYTPLEIYTHNRNEQQGITMSFTLLFKHLYSFTYSLSLSQEILKKKEEERKKRERELANQAAAGGKGKDDAEEEVEEEKKEDKNTSNFGQKMENMVFKCKFIVPEASEVIVDKRDRNAHKTFVQVSNGNENAKQKERDNLKDENDFDLQLYNITIQADQKIRKQIQEKIPTDQRATVSISRHALQAYAKNAPGSKSGAFNIKALASPILFADSAYLGAFLYNHADTNLARQKLHWYESPTSYQAVQRIIEPCHQSYQVDYPLMMYKGFAPDNRELVMVNLADQEQPQKIIHLYDMQFICFVGHNFSDREAKIGFLTLHGEQVKLCWLVCNQPFEKKDMNDLVDFTINEVPIPFYVPILKEIDNIVRCEYIAGVYGCLIIQTKTELWFSSCHTGNKARITAGRMAPIVMQRGFNSHFYYCEYAGNGGDCVLIELKLTIVNAQFQYVTQEIFKVNEGRVIALEMDPENYSETDSIYTYGNKLIPKQDHVLNKIYVVDDKENKIKIRQKGQDESGARYEVTEEVALNTIKGLTKELLLFKKTNFNRLSLTSRCVTLNDSNLSFWNGHKWSLNVERKSEDENDQDLTDDDDDDIEDKRRETKKSHYEIKSVESLDWTSRQLIQCSYQDYDKDLERYKGQYAFITKLEPGTRRCDLVGVRGLRDMESINLISDDLFLVKFRASDLSGLQDYWTLIDKHGQIRHLPNKTKDILIWSNFSAGISSQKRSGCTMILCGGQKPILSLQADCAYDEQEITSIEFNRFGEVVETKVFSKHVYDDILRKHIEHELMTNRDLTTNTAKSNVLTKQEARETAEGLQYQENIIVNRYGDLYRIATVVNKRIDDNYAINLVEDKSKDNADTADRLRMGLFVVKARNTVENYANSKLWKVDKDLKIVVFLCKSERDRFLFNRSGFCVCGDYLCWSYPDEKIVHILNMAKMNEIKVIEKPKSALTAVANVGMQGIANLAKMPTSFFAKQDVSQTDDQFKRVGQDGQVTESNQSMMTDEDETEFFAQLDAPPDANRRSTMLQNNNQLMMIDTTDQNLAQRRSTKVFSARDTAPDKEVKDSLVSNRQPTMTQGTTEDVLDYKCHISWEHFITRTIDLSVLCESDADCYNTHLAEVPKSTQLSINRSNEQADREAGDIKLRQNLLQVTVRNNTIIYDITEQNQNEVRHRTIYEKLSNFFGMGDDQEEQEVQEAKEIFFFNATRQFINPQNYVESGLQIVEAREDMRAHMLGGYIIDQIITNRQKDICYHKIDRRTFKFNRIQNRKQPNYKLTEEYLSTPRTTICGSIFKLYAELDLQELSRIQDALVRRIDDIDIQTALCTFDDHTVFSIFTDSIPFHEQVKLQLIEQEFPDEEQEDESLLENNQMRRLYRILNLPTPEIQVKDDKKTDDKKKSKGAASHVGRSGVDSNVDGPLRSQATQISDALNTQTMEDNVKDLALVALNDMEEDKQEEEEVMTKQGLRSVLYKGLYHDKTRVKDCLLAIANRCQECNLANFCETQDDFEELLANLSGQGIELIQESFTQTPLTKRIMSTSWHSQESMITFRLPTTIVTEQMCDDIIVKRLLKTGYSEESFTKAQVEVRILDLSWMLRGKKDFVEFVKILGESGNEQIYTTELVNTLLDEFWQENYQKILYRCMFPWLAYAVCALFFFSSALSAEDGSVGLTILGILALILLTYQVGIEVMQNREGGDWRDYFYDLINLIDIFQVSITLWIIVTHLIGARWPADETQRVMAALASLCLWIKVLDWCKLFDGTSFFIKLIVETILDIKYFSMIFIVCLMMFGTPMYILNMNRGVDGEDDYIINSTFGNIWVLNAFYNQYMLSLGEFNIDYFSGYAQQYLCFFFFLLSTFFTQITFLNMLIAIMGDTYGRVMENKIQYGLQTKLQIMGDYTAVILDKAEEEDTSVYMFVVQQKMEDGDDPNAAWEGNLNLIKTTLDKAIQNLQKNIDKKINAVQASNLAFKTRDLLYERDSRNQYQRIMDKFMEVDERFAEIEPDKQQEIQKIVKRSRVDANTGVDSLKESNSTLKNLQAQQLEQAVEIETQLKEKVTGTREQLLEELKEVKQSQDQLKLPGSEVIESEGLEEEEKKGPRAGTQDAEIQKLTDAQDQVVQSIQGLKERQETFEQTIENNRESAAEVKSIQSDLMRELKQLKTAQHQFKGTFEREVQTLQQQTQPPVDKSDEVVNNLTGKIQEVIAQLSASQQQMQQAILDDQNTFKSQILQKMQEQPEPPAAQQQEDDDI